MATLVFPVTRQPIPNYDLQKEDIIVRNPTTAGYTMTRLSFTKARTQPMNFKWQYMTDAEYLQLMSFFENDTANGSLPFSFTFKTATITRVYTVIFSKPPETSYVGMGLWEVTCVFEEQLNT